MITNTTTRKAAGGRAITVQADSAEPAAVAAAGMPTGGCAWEALVRLAEVSPATLWWLRPDSSDRQQPLVMSRVLLPAGRLEAAVALYEQLLGTSCDLSSITPRRACGWRRWAICC